MIRNLKRIQGIAPGQLQHPVGMCGEMTGFSGDIHQGFSDVRTGIPDGYERGNVIAAAVAADEGLDLRPHGPDIPNRVRNIMRSTSTLLADEQSSAGEPAKLEK
jgi:hypothetical protein